MKLFFKKNFFLNFKNLSKQNSKKKTFRQIMGHSKNTPKRKSGDESNKKRLRPPLVQFRRFCLNNIQNKQDIGQQKKISFSPKFLKKLRSQYLSFIRKQARETLYVCQNTKPARKTILKRDVVQKRDLQK